MKINKYKTIFFVLIMLRCSFVAANDVTQFANGKVVSVHDGDTITLRTDEGETVKIRFYGIDCPESAWEGHWQAQPYSAEAKAFVKNMILDKTVSVRLKERETYGRRIGEVFYDGRSLSRELARAGLAWWSKKYEPQDLDLKRLVNAARSARKGLWQDQAPKPPWRYRWQNKK